MVGRMLLTNWVKPTWCSVLVMALVRINLGKISENDPLILSRSIVAKYGSYFTPNMLGFRENLALTTSMENVFFHFVFIKKFRVRDVIGESNYFGPFFFGCTWRTDLLLAHTGPCNRHLNTTKSL
jgi:hypothetical protein